MGKSFKPFPAPKRGVERMIAKRPASVKTSAWNKVPYQRHVQGPLHLRKDQTKWHRTLQEILTATDRGILDMLRKDKLIGDWSEATVHVAMSASWVASLPVQTQNTSLIAAIARTASATSRLWNCILCSLRPWDSKGFHCRSKLQHSSFALSMCPLPIFTS